MQKRAGLLYISSYSHRVLLILENEKWTVPTFSRGENLIEDAKKLQDSYASGKILPVELYLSRDAGFEYSTYICLINEEFIPGGVETFSWASLDYLPKNIHTGLRSTLNNNLIRTKIETVLELENAITN